MKDTNEMMSAILMVRRIANLVKPDASGSVCRMALDMIQEELAPWTDEKVLSYYKAEWIKCPGCGRHYDRVVGPLCSCE